MTNGERRERSTAPMYSPEEITEKREEMGLTMAEFAEELGTQRQTVSNWENGHSVPMAPHRVKLKRLFARYDV